MSTEHKIKHLELYNKINSIANQKRFAILELTSQKSHTTTELSEKLNLAYNKCADYLALLYKNGLVDKQRKGKIVEITSKVKINDNLIEF